MVFASGGNYQSELSEQENSKTEPINFEGTPAGDILKLFMGRLRTSGVRDLNEIHEGLRNPIWFFGELCEFNYPYLISEYFSKLAELQLSHDTMTFWLEEKERSKTNQQQFFTNQIIAHCEKMSREELS